MSGGNQGEIYNIPGSGWKSPSWNWGYGQGTGHDCAMICRKRWASREDRKDLLLKLTNPTTDENREPNFEEVKLILGLAFQNGRWDRSDGGRGGYGEVLAIMANADRYESDDEDTNATLFSKDLMERFNLIASIDAMDEMNQVEQICGDDVDLMRRKCSALVLSQMGFVDKGL